MTHYDEYINALYIRSACGFLYSETMISSCDYTNPKEIHHFLLLFFMAPVSRWDILHTASQHFVLKVGIRSKKKGQASGFERL